MTQLQTAPANGAIAVHPATPMDLIQAAIEKGYAPDQLSALMDLQERHERNEAAREYAIAVTTFQAKCPPVVKRREAKGQGNFAGYNYAAYEDIMAIAGPLLAEVGLSVSFSTEPHEKGLMGTIYLRKGIHQETRTMYLPIADMRVNDTQKYGATVTYMERYLLRAALNIVVVGEDNDAQGLHETITEEQAIQLKENMEGRRLNGPRLFKAYSIEKLRDLPASRFDEFMAEIKATPFQ